MKRADYEKIMADYCTPIIQELMKTKVHDKIGGEMYKAQICVCKKRLMLELRLSRMPEAICEICEMKDD